MVGGYFNVETDSFCEVGKEYFSRFHNREPVKIEDGGYDDMLDAVQFDITKAMNKLKQSYFKDEVQASVINFKINLPCLTKSQKETIETQRKTEEEKKAKREEFVKKLQSFASEASELGLEIKLPSK